MCTLEKINPKIGTWLYLRLDAENVSKAVLIGIRPKKYIATTWPIPYFSKDIDKLTVYFHNGTNLYEFKTKVVKFFNDPIEFILLQYPDYVNIKEQRSYKRIKCFVSAKIHYKIEGSSGVIEGIIRDVSKKGCRVAFPSKKIEKELFKKNEGIIIMCKFPGIPGEQQVTGKIRNIIEDEKELSLGIEFNELAWWAPPY